MKKKVLILYAHPDDEIFTFTQIANFPLSNYEIGINGTTVDDTV